MPLPKETYSSFEKFTGEGHFIAVVKTERKLKNKKKEGKVETQFRQKTPDSSKWSEAWSLKPNLIENLSNSSPHFSPYARLSQKFSIKFLVTEDAYIKAEKGFDFWDRFDVSNPFMAGYQAGMSCGLSYPILQDNHYYIAFGMTVDYPEENTTVNLPTYFEPISGLSDPFLEQLRHAIKGSNKSPLIISAEAFFKNMKGFAEIELTSCEFDYYEYELSRKMLDYQRQKNLTAKIIDDYKIDKTDIYLADLTHQNLVRNNKLASDGDCRIGDRYLVTYRPVTPNPRHEYGVMKNRNTYLKFRFLPIIDEHIKTSRILTNYDIQGDELLKISNIKSWIKAGNTSDL